MRSATASLLGRLMAQPLHGPRVALLAGRVLPPGLVAALADGPSDAALTVRLQHIHDRFILCPNSHALYAAHVRHMVPIVGVPFN